MPLLVNSFSRTNILITEMIQPLVEETITSFPSLLAYCSSYTNKIEVVDFDTQQSYASFEGVKITQQSTFRISNYFEADIAKIFLELSSTYVKEIPNTKLLVSLQHSCSESANLAVFDISKTRPSQ